jgi:hypothetical protein
MADETSQIQSQTADTPGPVTVSKKTVTLKLRIHPQSIVLGFLLGVLVSLAVMFIFRSLS